MLLCNHQQQPLLNLVSVQPAAQQCAALLNYLGKFLWVITFQQVVEVLEKLADLLCLVRLIAEPLRLWGLRCDVFGMFLCPLNKGGKGSSSFLFAEAVPLEATLRLIEIEHVAAPFDPPLVKLFRIP